MRNLSYVLDAKMGLAMEDLENGGLAMVDLEGLSMEVVQALALLKFFYIRGGEFNIIRYL